MHNPFIELKAHAMQLMKDQGYTEVYDYIPDKGNQYIFFDAMTNVDIDTKDRTLGQCTLNIQFYDYPDGENNIIVAIDNLIGALKIHPNTEHFSWYTVSKSSSITNDTTGNVPLKHGTLDITLEYR